MKIKKSTVAWMFVVLLFCLFMGVTAISIGAGAAFPKINYVASPFVCSNGTLSYEAPQGTTTCYGKCEYISLYYCINKSTGAKTGLDESSEFKMNIYAGLVYGVLLFLVILLLIVINGLLNRTYAN